MALNKYYLTEFSEGILYSLLTKLNEIISDIVYSKLR